MPFRYNYRVIRYEDPHIKFQLYIHDNIFNSLRLDDGHLEFKRKLNIYIALP